MLTGRALIIETLREHVRAGRSAFVIGEEGVGKTAILQEVIREGETFLPRLLIYCPRVRRIRDCLLASASFFQQAYGDAFVRARLCGQGALPSKLSTAFWERLPLRSLRRLVVPQLRAGKYILLLDHISPLNSSDHAFFEWLIMECRVPLVLATHDIQPAQLGKLWWLTWAFAEVHVPPLRLGEVRAVIRQQMEVHRVVTPDDTAFIRDVSRMTDNPKMITRICQLAGDPRYRTPQGINLRLVALDLKIHDVQQQIAIVQ